MWVWVSFFFFFFWLFFKGLTAQEAEALGYEDGHKAHGEGYTLYVDGYNSLEAIQNFLDEVAATEAAYSEADDEENDRGGEQ